MGIGAMTDERWQNFFDFAADAGLYPTGSRPRRAPTPRSSSIKKVGMELKQ